jgi:hypothetical protein
VQVETQPYGSEGHVHFTQTPETFGVFHTHSLPLEQKPSGGDEASAKAHRINIYTATRNGLFITEPDGKTTQIYNRSDWASQKK